MSMTVVVREAFCVYTGGSLALQGRSLPKGCEKGEMNTRRNKVETTCLATARLWIQFLNKTIR